MVRVVEEIRFQIRFSYRRRMYDQSMDQDQEDRCQRRRRLPPTQRGQSLRKQYQKEQLQVEVRAVLQQHPAEVARHPAEVAREREAKRRKALRKMALLAKREVMEHMATLKVRSQVVEQLLKVVEEAAEEAARL